VVYDFNGIPSQSSNRGIGIELLGVSDSRVYNNLVYDGRNISTGLSIIGRSADGVVTRSSDRNDIFNNLFYNMSRAGIHLLHPSSSNLAGRIGPNALRDNRIHNNIVMGADYGGVAWNGEIVLMFMDKDYDSWVASGAAGNSFSNNVVLSLDGSVGDGKVTYSQIFRHRNDVTLAELNDPVAGVGTGNLGAGSPVAPDVLFAAPATGDLHFAANPAGWAPQRPVGQCLDRMGGPLVETDHHGVPRPLPACQVGPYEVPLPPAP
jgi:hypothetical protein